MTVVAAYARDGVVTMAADRATNYQGVDFIGATKIRRIPVGDGEALLSCAGNGALPGVLAAHWKLDEAPDPGNAGDVLDWANMAASAATEILADTNPPLTEAGEGGTRIDGALLLGWHGRLIYLFTHQAAVVQDGIAALGIGADMAIGVLHASRRRAPESACRLAVEVACQRLQGCRTGPDGPQVEQLPTPAAAT